MGNTEELEKLPVLVVLRPVVGGKNHDGNIAPHVLDGDTEEDTRDVLSDIAEMDYSGKRVLLVEDNELNQEIAVEILQETGFILDVADDGL